MTCFGLNTGSIGECVSYLRLKAYIGYEKTETFLKRGDAPYRIAHAALAAHAAIELVFRLRGSQGAQAAIWANRSIALLTYGLLFNKNYSELQSVNAFTEALQPWQRIALCLPFIPLSACVKFEEELGSGCYGKVFLVEFGGKKFALKQGEVEKDYSVARQMSPFSHICQYYAKVNKFGSDSIFLEYISGEDLGTLSYRGRLNEKGFDFLSQLADSCLELEAFDYCYDDFIPRNVMLNEKGKVKFVDWGSLTKKDEGHWYKASRHTHSIVESLLSSQTLSDPKRALLEELDGMFRTGDYEGVILPAFQKIVDFNSTQADSALAASPAATSLT